MAMKVKSALKWRTDRVNVFAYGSPGSGKTYFANTFPMPVFIDVEDGIRTIQAQRKEMGLHDIPILQPEAWSDIMVMGMNPETAIRKALQGTKFADYAFETIVLDTVSGMEELCLNSILAKTDHDLPELGDYKPLAHRMRPLFRQMWKQPYNTVLLAHVFHGGVAITDKKTGTTKPPAPAGPALTGMMREQGPGLADFYIKLETEEVGSKTKYVARTQTHQGYPARVRGVDKFLKNRIENPSYAHLREALDKLEAA